MAYPIHLGDSEEGLNRRGARDLDTIGRLDEVGHLNIGGNTGKALGGGDTGQLRRHHNVRRLKGGS